MYKDKTLPRLLQDRDNWWGSHFCTSTYESISASRSREIVTESKKRNYTKKTCPTCPGSVTIKAVTR